MRTGCGFPKTELAVGESARIITKVTVDYQPTRTIIIASASTRVHVRSILVAGKETLGEDGKGLDSFGPQSADTIQYPAAKSGDEIVIDAINHGPLPCMLFTTMLGEAEDDSLPAQALR